MAKFGAALQQATQELLQPFKKLKKEITRVQREIKHIELLEKKWFKQSQSTLEQEHTDCYTPGDTYGQRVQLCADRYG